jgi:phage tail-like protein
VLTRGIAIGPVLWEWYQAGLSGSLGARRDGAVILQDPRGLPVTIWTFRAGLAARWTGPELNAQQNSLAIEKLEIAHQGMSTLSAVNIALGAISAAF